MNRKSLSSNTPPTKSITMQHPLDILEEIQQTEAPPFLLTRIRQKINGLHTSGFSPRLTWSLGISLLTVLLINAAVLMKQSGHSHENAGSHVAVFMHLVPDNSLYK